MFEAASQGSNLCYIFTICETLLFLVLFVSFRLLHCNHPSGWGVGVTVVLFHNFLKDVCKESYGVLDQRELLGCLFPTF